MHGEFVKLADLRGTFRSPDFCSFLVKLESHGQLVTQALAGSEIVTQLNFSAR